MKMCQPGNCLSLLTGLCVLWGVVLGFFSFGFAGTLHVSRAAISLDVLQREPVGEGLRFSANVQRVYCFTAVEGAASPTTITHVWFFEDDAVHEYTLPVDASTWRTWSYKNIGPHQKGDWEVEIRDDRGYLLTTAQFTVY